MHSRLGRYSNCSYCTTLSVHDFSSLSHHRYVHTFFIHMAKKPGPPYLSTDSFRDTSKQKAYSDQSQSQYKEDKDTSHIVSLRIAKAALNDHRPPGRPPTEEWENVMALLNRDSNLRMVKRETNRLDHERIDKAIIDKSKSGKILTAEEEHRAKQQVRVIQKEQKLLQQGSYCCFKTLYQKLKTQSGKVVWDARRDKRYKSWVSCSTVVPGTYSSILTSFCKSWFLVNFYWARIGSM